MQHKIQIDCPPEILLGLHMNAETFARLVKKQTAFSLFKDGCISSSMAAHWLNMPRVVFLLQAMESGVELLDDSEDDFRRETSLL
ncbi:UPF0175 family protein [Candidatus Venteria ishoeyi]|uniref:Uncharacterized protein n=1 Tax=Candidatus Venteria ishoeyi TaxID=1899563 RepID=A0A1H6FFK1_9GAMM|nr:UPF0175 family protein [Candidatus Venteria ishoeyi]SEH08129.1 Uncharacterised protein [Candidatus Venteria ishoeyi]